MLIIEFSVRKYEPLIEGAPILRTPNTFDIAESLLSKRSRYFNWPFERKAGIATCFSLGQYVSLTDSPSSIKP